MAIKGKDLRGSGSKENVGRKSRPYPVKNLHKEVPEEILDSCKEAVDKIYSQWKRENNY